MIITDHKWKPFRYRYEVPERVLKDDLDWCEPEEEYFDGFFKYRGQWYHLAEFLRGSRPEGYHGFHADSFFSGVAIKLSEDCGEYQVATYIA